MAGIATKKKTLWRLIVVGGHTRSIGKTQLVCDVIRAFPRTEWIAGKITQYGHGVCAQDGENCDCAPTEHACALDWETRSDIRTDSARFLEAGAKRSFWLRTKQGHLAEAMPLLRKALQEVEVEEIKELKDVKETLFPQALKPGESPAIFSDLKVRPPMLREVDRFQNRAVIVESNSLMQFVKPSLYFAVIDPLKEDFKESAQLTLDRAHALVLRGDTAGDAGPAPLWMKLPAQLMREKPSVLQREGEPLPEPLWVLVHRILDEPPAAAL
jgi:hypothetical protein